VCLLFVCAIAGMLAAVEKTPVGLALDMNEGLSTSSKEAARGFPAPRGSVVQKTGLFPFADSQDPLRWTWISCSAVAKKPPLYCGTEW